MQGAAELGKMDRLYRYKRKIIFGILALLTASIVLTMIVIGLLLRDRLIEDSKRKTRELGEVIQSSLSHLMFAHDPGKIQETLMTIGADNSSVLKAFVLDKNGRVVYSSAERDIGRIIDRFAEESCRGCHRGPVTVPHDTTMLITVDGERVLRNVNVILNEAPCHGCHAPSDRINGKLIIDRSISPTYALITTVIGVITGSGIICLVVLVPFLWRYLSKGVDTYIDEIVFKSTELSVLYGVVERLSKTIEFEELRHVVVDIVRDALDADVIHILAPKEGAGFGGITWLKSEQRIDRTHLSNDDPVYPYIAGWLAGALAEEKVDGQGDRVYIPIAKGGHRLALIIAGKQSGRFEPARLGLIRAMRSHIAVAFENAMLYQIAITDELTGLFTKRHFRQVIEKRFSLFEQYGEKFTLLMLDIDNFKNINDTYGHPAGDLILRDLAQCVMEASRDGDMDFRYGGEEFVVILPDTDVSGGTLVAERVRGMVESSPFSIGERTIRVTVSIGVASCPANAQTIKDLILAADRALYEAKRTGKNRVVVSPAG